MTPLKQREARIAELKAFSTTILLFLDNTHKFLEDTTFTWDSMEEIDDLVEVCAVLHKNQQELDTVVVAMKDMPPLQRMLKMGENKRL